jgi:hypothetical protein
MNSQELQTAATAEIEAATPKLHRLPVTVDKSHIVTIGEKLYSQSVELIRELVNNAYDADAAKVFVEIHDERIEVRDDGLGMDLDGLRQYFNIGSNEKVLHNKSPKFDRDRIGQFGIGKFATLAACRRFEVVTQRGDFAARVIIYINRDHPLYVHEAKKAASHTMHVARLLSQEIALMNNPEKPRQAFEQQSKILKAAFQE